MEMKLTTGVAILTALLMHCLSISPGIAHQQRALNTSTSGPDHNEGSGFSLQLVTIPEGPDHNARRHSDGFLHLQRSLTTSAMDQKNSALVHGRGVVVQIGTFRSYQEVILVVSTTSSLTWLQCEPCSPKVPQRHPLFNPDRSPSYHAIKGNSPKCHPPFEPVPGTDKCGFHLLGQEGIWASGYMSTDHFRINYGALEPDYTFGCSHITRTFNNAGQSAGVLAVGRAPTSLVTRAAARGLTNFSYCLSHETSHRSFLQFGADVPRMPVRYQTTRILLPHDAHDSAYHVKLIGVSLNKRRLDGVLPEMFARRKDGQGGCIVDLGTPMTTMAQEAYRVVEEAMWVDLKRHGAERVELAGYGLCVMETETIKKRLPSLSLHFAEEEAALVVSPEQLFVVIDVDRKIGQVVCLAVTPGRRTIIGALQQVDTRFVFDLKEDKLTFWPESCGQERV
ncbi:hypothetical protein HU200_063754 [Digitaria exilis]|uniref:Peptidase A1 domain-containing protein n=1 Tax=Digitaria exilis TaxID=1010633 RepID=A0A835A4Q9_9POAL|nr:hypothetical protein HU200_063754 [Digitaria exilis]CAB3489953.1 unnamed protein product [Digitaria exilis]